MGILGKPFSSLYHGWWRKNPVDIRAMAKPYYERLFRQLLGNESAAGGRVHELFLGNEDL